MSDKKPIIERHDTFTFVDKRGIVSEEYKINYWKDNILNKYT